LHPVGSYCTDLNICLVVICGRTLYSEYLTDISLVIPSRWREIWPHMLILRYRMIYMNHICALPRKNYMAT